MSIYLVLDAFVVKASCILRMKRWNNSSESSLLRQRSVNSLQRSTSACVLLKDGLTCRSGGNAFQRSNSENSLSRQLCVFVCLPKSTERS